MAKKSRTSGFTLVEILISVMLSGMILTAAYAAFQGIMKSQIRLGGVIDIQRNLFYLNEKLAYLIHNGGTLDYEEYFNRRMLKYDRSFPTNPSATQIFTFTTASHYGNGSATTKPKIYICGKDASTNNDACLTNAVREKGTSGTFTQSLSGQQAFGQYRELAFNYGSSLPSPTKLPSLFPQGSEIPVGMEKMDTEGLPELYLIKKIPDGSYERVYFRHVFVTDPNRNPSTDVCDPNDVVKKENCLGKIQMTKLKSCDREKSDGTTGTDGIIDAWIPTPEFSGLGTPINCDAITDLGNAAKDLVWVDVSSPEMNIVKALFLPSPDKIPGLMAGTGEVAVSPTVQLRIEVKLSESLQRRGLLTKESNTPRMLITTFDLPEA